MTIKNKNFRLWTGRPAVRNGRQPEEWQRYFSDEEIEAFADGVETPEMRKDRERFWGYAKNERKRLVRKAERDKDLGDTAPRKIIGEHDFLVAPTLTRLACARYWYYANILPRGRNMPAIGSVIARRALGLNERDAKDILHRFSDHLCREAAAQVENGGYPWDGIYLAQAQRSFQDVNRRTGTRPSPEPPKAVGKFIHPVDLDLGLSRHFYEDAYGRRVTYSWTADWYAEGQLKEEREIEELADSPEDYKGKLLSIFD